MKRMVSMCWRVGLLGMLVWVALFYAALPGFAQVVGEIEIPQGPPPTLDGEVTPGEWDDAAALPLEGLPLRAQALHDGESLYLVFEVLTPAEEWETFAVWDDGDGEFYEAGDSMALCSAEGCGLCQYTAEYTFTCEAGALPGAGASVVEVQVPMALNVGQVVIGAVLDGVEVTSDGFTLVAVEEAPPDEEPAGAEAIVTGEEEAEQPVLEATEPPEAEAVEAQATPEIAQEDLDILSAWLWLLIIILGLGALFLIFIWLRRWASKWCKKVAEEAQKKAKEIRNKDRDAQRKLAALRQIIARVAAAAAAARTAVDTGEGHSGAAQGAEDAGNQNRGQAQPARDAGAGLRQNAQDAKPLLGKARLAAAVARVFAPGIAAGVQSAADALGGAISGLEDTGGAIIEAGNDLEDTVQEALEAAEAAKEQIK